MSNQSVTVLCPNARRVVVKTTPNTSLLQILEQACAKQNYNADLYTFKHLQRTLDISSMLRFAGLPNRCVLEMQELAVPRQQQLVTVCVADAGGAKHVSQHLPSASLWAVVEASNMVGAEELSAAVPSVLFGLQRVCGRKALEDTSLKSLGLSGGRVSLRFLLQAAESEKEEAHPPAAVGNVLPEVVPRHKPEGAYAHNQSLVAAVNDKPEIIPEGLSMRSTQPEIIPVPQSLNKVQAEVADVAQPKGMEHVTAGTGAGPDVAMASSSANEVSPDVAMASSSANEVSPDVAMASSSANEVSPDVAMASSSANQISPDVVSSSKVGPDVVKRSNHITRPPDVLAAEPAMNKSLVTAFTGAGHSLSRPAHAASAVEHHPQQEEHHPQQEEHHPHQEDHPQLMEVDSTQDSAIMTLSARSAVVFDMSCAAREEVGPHFLEDDSFFEVTSEDVRKLHRDQLHQLQELSETPLLTQEMREADAQARLLACLRNFPVTTLRIQFPEGVAVQARFRPTDTVQDVALFVSALLRDEALEFDLLNLFPRAPLSRLQTLHAAGLVPRARVLFCPHGGGQDTVQAPLLKPSVLAQVVSRQHAQEALKSTRNNNTASRNDIRSSSSSARPTNRLSSSNTTAASDVGPPKKPKWFKLAK